MRTVLAVCAALLGSAAMADQPACPKREAGAAYPWQDLKPVPGDHSAIVYIDVDKTGRAIRCRVGKNDNPDPDMRFRLCLAYSEDWRAPPASDGDPLVRSITRNFTLLGYNHQMADQKARKAWFKQHPEERPACYPE